MKLKDKDNFEINLSDERWEHILYFHPEVGNNLDFISESLKDPDLIQAGNKYELLSIKI